MKNDKKYYSVISLSILLLTFSLSLSSYLHCHLQYRQDECIKRIINREASQEGDALKYESIKKKITSLQVFQVIK